ncbi:MAG: hypothetical protein RMK99_15110, partial [Anaerolineales bacterium]|nr:hypothetical protein [Anaerolineales bacterium]
FDVALRVADEVLRQGVQGLTELIGKPGLINVDFAHVRHIMQDGGNAMMAIGQGRGENKAEQAVQQALKMPLLDIPNLRNARGVLVHFTGGDDLSLFEISRAAEQLQRAAPQADIIFGAAVDNTMLGRAQVILIVTGYDLPPLASEPLLPPEAIPASPAVLAPAPAKAAFGANASEAPMVEPAGRLANALFSRAIAAGTVAEETMVVTEPPTANPNSLDIPAFLRRRRTLRDIERA